MPPAGRSRAWVLRPHVDIGPAYERHGKATQMQRARCTFARPQRSAMSVNVSVGKDERLVVPANSAMQRVDLAVPAGQFCVYLATRHDTCAPQLHGGASQMMTVFFDMRS